MTGNGFSGNARNKDKTKRPIEPASDNDPPKPDGHQSKRTRVSRACDQCRASREKCNGAQPSCQTCLGQARTCSYNEQPKKRGIQPNYIRTLETILAWMLQTTPECGRLLSIDLASNDSSTLRTLAGKDVSASETLHQKWRDSLLSTQVDQMLSGASIDAPSSPTLDKSENHSNGQGALNLLTTAARQRGPPPHTSSVHPLSAEDAEILKLPEQAWTLLEYYFAFTHAWLPITDKSAMLKLMYSWPTEGLRLSACQAQHAELWSILALAVTQLPLDMPFLNSKYMKDRAWRILTSSDVDDLEIGHVRASLLVGLSHITEDHYIAGWIAIGFASRLLVILSGGESVDSQSGT